MRRLDPEATQPCDQKREALEGDEHVEHVLEEVESGDGGHDQAAVVACGHTECEREEARREAHEREEEDERAKHAVERLNAQELIDGLMVVVGGGCAAYGRESGEAQNVENDTHGAKRREHEEIERVEQPRRLYLREEQLHLLGRERSVCRSARIHIDQAFIIIIIFIRRNI